MILGKFQNRLKAKIGRMFGLEPYVRLKLIERNLQRMGYTRSEAKRLIAHYQKARKNAIGY